MSNDFSSPEVEVGLKPPSLKIPKLMLSLCHQIHTLMLFFLTGIFIKSNILSYLGAYVSLLQDSPVSMDHQFFMTEMIPISKDLENYNSRE